MSQASGVPDRFQPVDPAAERSETVIVALGTTLLATAVTVATVWSRWEDGDLDLPVYLIGVVAALGLIGVAVASRRLVADPDRRSNLFAWPGAVGAVSVGLVLGVGIDDMPGLGYLIGAVILALSVAGHLLSPRPPFVLSGLAGLTVLYFEVVTDVFDAAIDINDLDDNIAMIASVAFVAYAVALTVLARRFLPSGDFTGLVVGVGAVVFNVAMAVGLGIAGALSAAFAGLGEWDEETGDYVESTPPDNVYDNDLWVLLLCAAVLVGFWLWLAHVSGHVGYRVLALVQSALLVPVVTVALGVDHAAVWAGVLLLGGVVVLGFVLSRAIASGRTPTAPGN